VDWGCTRVLFFFCTAPFFFAGILNEEKILWKRVFLLWEKVIFDLGKGDFPMEGRSA